MDLILRQRTRPTNVLVHPVGEGLGAVAITAFLAVTATSCTSEPSAPASPAVSSMSPNAIASSKEPLEPSPSAVQTTMPLLREDAIARSTLSDGEIFSTTLNVAEEGVEYVLLTACDGNPQQMLGFSVTVDNVEGATSGTWGCGGDVIYTVLNTAKGGETVWVQLEVLKGLPEETLSATVEVVPVSIIE